MNGFSLFFKAFYEGMKTFGACIVDIVNFVLLIPVYFIGVGLTAIIAKMFGKHFMNLKKPDKKAKTYWVDKEQKKPKIDDFYKEF